MAKPASKNSQPQAVTSKNGSKKVKLFKRLQARLQLVKEAQAKKTVRFHRSFKRSYREDYQRDFQAPGLLSHAVQTFQILGKNWRTFAPLAIISVGLYVVLVGLLSEELYQELQDLAKEPVAGAEQSYQPGSFVQAGLLLISTVATGGLNTAGGETEGIFGLMIFLMIWLTVIYLLRHFLAGRKPKLRDGLYNACAPLIATLVIVGIIFIQLLPVFLVIITYNAAMLTDFLATPFYALVYFIFASLMLLLSGYLLSSSIIALIAATAPGIYPLKALSSAYDLMAGRRIKFIIRVIYLFFVIALVYVLVMLPVILLDMWLKSWVTFIQGWPIVSFVLLSVTCFVFIYASAYLYLYYRRMLDYQEK